MWYVIQVRALHETEVCDLCKRDVLIPGESIFVFRSEKFVRQRGSWEKKTIPTFQKYIFVETGDVDGFRQRLKAVKQMTKFIGAGDEIVPIYPEEEAWLRRLGGPEHIVTVSEASLVGEDITVLSGPMKGLECNIKWINRRQKTIGIGISLLGNEQTIKVAMEFVDPPKSG